MRAILMAMAVATVTWADVELTANKGGWDIKADGYTARIGARGYLMGLESGGVQFIAPAGITPGGCYLCMEGHGPLRKVRREGKTGLRGENRWGETKSPSLFFAERILSRLPRHPVHQVVVAHLPVVTSPTRPHRSVLRYPGTNQSIHSRKLAVSNHIA